MIPLNLSPSELATLWYICNNAQSHGIKEILSLTSSDKAYLLSRSLPMWAHETQEEFDIIHSIKSKATVALNSMSLHKSDNTASALTSDELTEIEINSLDLLRAERGVKHSDIDFEEETNPVAPNIDEEELQA